VRAIIGIILSAAGAVAAGSAIVTLTQLGNCVGACSAHTQVVPYMAGGIIAVVVSAFFWRYAMVLAPVVGLATAAVQLQREGVEILGDNIGFTAFIAVCVLAGPAILALIGLGGAARRARAQAIARDGKRAVAEVQQVRGTGVQINNQPQVSITFMIHPLDGSQPFTYTSRRTISYGEVVPRPGLRWPAWYVSAKKVAIGSPNASPTDPQTRSLLSEFGIAPAQAYGFDPAGGQGVAAGPAFGTFGSAYQGSGD
jgi:hypothetical protein